jgi:transposase-like protein
MAHGSTTTLSKRGEYWLGHLQRREQAGITQAEYCRRHGLSVAAFRWWRRKFLHEGRLATRDGGTADSGFVEVVTSMSPGPGASNVYEIVLPNHRRLRLRGRFEAHAVRTLISVLEGPC